MILQLLAVILHLFLSKTVYENYTKINFENVPFVPKLSEMMKKSERLGIVINLIDEKEMRWMELDEMQ